MKINLLLFSKGEHYKVPMNKIKEKALKNKIVDRVFDWTYEDLKKTNFYTENKDLLESHKIGYWAWKPYLIKETLKKINEGDYLIYHDGGNAVYRYYKNSFNIDLHPFCNWITKNFDGVLPGVYQDEKHVDHCKQDCFHFMNCNEDKYKSINQVSASWSFWQKGSPKIHPLLDEWLYHCLDRRCISDNSSICGTSEISTFKVHRHDQAILTNLIIKHNIALPPFIKIKDILIQERGQFNEIVNFTPQRYMDIIISYFLRYENAPKFTCKFDSDVPIKLKKNPFLEQNNNNPDCIIKVKYPFNLQIDPNSKFTFVIIDFDMGGTTINNIESLSNIDNLEKLYFIVKKSNANQFMNWLSLQQGVKLNNNLFIFENNFYEIIQDIYDKVLRPYNYYKNLLTNINDNDQLKSLIIKGIFNAESILKLRDWDNMVNLSVKTLTIKDLPYFIHSKINSINLIYNIRHIFIPYLNFLDKVTNFSNHINQYIVRIIFAKIKFYAINEKFVNFIKNLIDTHLPRLLDKWNFIHPELYARAFGINDEYGKKCRKYINNKIQNLWKKHNLEVKQYKPGEKKKMAFILLRDEFYHKHAVFKFLKDQLIELLNRYDCDLYLVTEDNDTLQYILKTNSLTNRFKNIRKLKINLNNLPKFYNMQNQDINDLDLIFSGLKPITEGGYFGIYYATIGFDLLSIYLMNIKLAPIQMSGYGHLNSSYNSKLTHFIMSRDYEKLEKISDLYSEKPIWTDNFTTIPKTIKKINNNRINVNNNIIGLSVHVPKLSVEFMKFLERLSTHNDIHYDFFTGTGQKDKDHIGLEDLMNHYNFKYDLKYWFDKFEDYIDAKQNVRFYIDSYYYGGYTSVFEGLLLGVPVVVFEQDHVANRQAAYIVKKFGFPELVVQSEEELFNLCVKLIEDNDFYIELLIKLRHINWEDFKDTIPFKESLHKSLQDLEDEVDGIILHKPKQLINKKAIVVLTRGYKDLQKYKSLIERNRAIKKQNLINTDYLIFHEGNIPAEHQHHIQSHTPNIYLQFINVSDVFLNKLPKNLYSYVRPDCFGNPSWLSLGYRNMCAFWFTNFWSYVQDYDKIIRIDEDCVIKGNLNNIFNELETFTFSFAIFNEDYEFVTHGMNEFTKEFIDNNNLESNTSIDTTYVLKLYCEKGARVRDEVNCEPNCVGPYTNLIGLNLEKLSGNNLVRTYIEKVKQSNKIYTHRWGDLPLWGQVIDNLYTKKDYILSTNISYYHGSHGQEVVPINK